MVIEQPQSGSSSAVEEPPRGIWFFTLEAANPLAVLGACLSYGLPYRWTTMSIGTVGDVFEYQSRRRDSSGVYGRILIRPGAPLPTSPLAALLTARFRLYTTLRGKLALAHVEHEPWPLGSAEVLRLDETVIKACGLRKGAVPPLTHFSAGVPVRIGAPKLS